MDTNSTSICRKCHKNLLNSNFDVKKDINGLIQYYKTCRQCLILKKNEGLNENKENIINEFYSDKEEFDFLATYYCPFSFYIHKTEFTKTGRNYINNQSKIYHKFIERITPNESVDEDTKENDEDLSSSPFSFQDQDAEVDLYSVDYLNCFGNAYVESLHLCTKTLICRNYMKEDKNSPIKTCTSFILFFCNFKTSMTIFICNIMKI